MGLIYENAIGIANKIAGQDVSADYPCTIAGAIDAIADQLAGENVDTQGSIAGALGTLAEYVEGGGGGSQLGEQVALKAASGLDDFGFAVFLGDTYVASGSTDTAGVPVAAGTTIKTQAPADRTGTYTIGEGEPQALVREGEFLKFTIPVDTPYGTGVVVDGNF